MASFDRYSKFKLDGAFKKVPFIPIEEKNTDVYTYYERGKTRLDLLSYQYYNDANYDWLIMQANPQYGSLEFMIPDGARLRIPYPLNITLNQYNASIEKYFELNGE